MMVTNTVRKEKKKKQEKKFAKKVAVAPFHLVLLSYENRMTRQVIYACIVRCSSFDTFAESQLLTKSVKKKEKNIFR